MEKKAIEYLRGIDPKLAKVIDRIGCLNPVHHDNSFIFLVREIMGQMISAKLKKVLFNRLQNLCHNNITPLSVSTIKKEQLRDIGLSYAKSEYILNLSNLFLRNQNLFDELSYLPDADVIKRLISIKGIGMWTSKMYLIFYLQRNDILPYEDAAFVQAFKWLYKPLNTEKETIVNICKKWRPYSSIGARYLYVALDSGLTKIPPESL